MIFLKSQSSLSFVACLLLIGLSTPSKNVNANDETSLLLKAPQTPVFADNYRVHGVLSLPYAELNEPFSAYFDKQADRSRTDYFGGEYQVYQYGPRSAPSSAPANSNNNNSTYGAIYKLLYVPESFHLQSDRSRARQLLAETLEKLPFNRADITEKQVDETEVESDEDENEQASELVDEKSKSKASRTRTKRACFGVQGGVGFTISAQSVLPKLTDFSYDSTGRCPHVSSSPETRQAKCELWRLTSSVGDKKNTYKFWLRRDPNNSSLAIPVHYYMLGYDTLLGSHYDRYDVSYFHFQADGAQEDDFKLDVKGQKCGSMPGPGANNNDNDNGGPAPSSSEQRAHIFAQNPIHAYVEEPQRYDHIDQHFDQFKKQFPEDSKYLDKHSERKGWFNFMHNLRFIHGKNRELRDFKLEVNKFADENVRELKYLRGRRHSSGYNGGLDYAQHHPHLFLKSGDAPKLPDSFDWTVLGAVTPVKDQAVCGSCWSFGTSGAVEGAYFVKTGRLIRLSQQQMIDCSWQFGNNGCDGGEDFRAYAYIMKAGGLAMEENYGHYKAIDGRCHDEDVEKPAKIKGFYNVTRNSVEALKHAIVNYGPVSISLDASQPTFTFYSHGAYYDEKCKNSDDSLDHSVLAVGYTTINGRLVWKIKNSWSTYWGNDGYIYMAAENNNCGVLDMPTVPIVDV